MTTTWRQVARKDVADAARSKMLWGIVTVFVVLMGLLLVLASVTFSTDGEFTAEMALAFVAETAQLFVPVVALIAAYMAVVGERRTGSLRVLLSYPFSRADVVIGKFVGRALVIVSALAVALAITIGLAVVVYGAPSTGAAIGIAGAVLLFGLAFTGLGIGVSAATSSRGKAMAVVLGIYLGCLLFWKPLVAGIHYVVGGSLPGLEVPAWYFLLLRLNPIEAFRSLADAVLEPGVSSPFVIPVEDIPPGTPPERFEVANRVAGDLPIYLSEWAPAVVLLAWAILPVAIGTWQFARAELD